LTGPRFAGGRHRVLCRQHLRDRHARWRRWGANVARAVGTYSGNRDYKAHAVIRLSRPQRCSYQPERVYSHFWIRIGNEEPISYRLEGCS
jgi:hypothetical protein